MEGSLSAPVARKGNPLASPLYGDLRGLPPLLLHASTSELLRDDSVRLATRGRRPLAVALGPILTQPRHLGGFTVSLGAACLSRRRMTLLQYPPRLI
jgi:hypothetical protein